MKNLIIVCDDWFGLEVYSIIDRTNAMAISYGVEKRYNVLGYISDKEAPFEGVRSPIERIGRIHDWRPIGEEKYVLGIKCPARKKESVSLLTEAGCEFETIIAPWTLRAPIEIGEGSFVAAYSIKPGMKIGRYVTLVDSMMSSKMVGDYSTVLRFSNVTGSIDALSYVGNHVYTHLGKAIGNNCFVADGSIVVKDVKSGTSVFGVPAQKTRNKPET